MIPMVDTRVWHKSIQSELEQAAVDVLRSGRFIMGPEVAAFEQEAAAFLGAEYALGCANGTDALVLALKAAGIGAGDEVITTPFTFFATVEAIVLAGAVPVFVDIDPVTFNLNPEFLKQALTVKTRAVLLVHLFGLPAAVEAVQDFCEHHQLLLLEDCAQSFGAEVNGRKTGTFGQLGCFSFFPSKNLGGFGDGGLITTSDSHLAERVRQLRNHGSCEPYKHLDIGHNSRLDELQAALLRIKLRSIDDYNRQRQQVAEWYRHRLETNPVRLPEGEGHVFHQYTILLQDRDRVQKRLAENDIASAVYYRTPLHQQTALRGIAVCRELVVTGQISQQCLSLPVFPGMTENQVERVAEQVIDSLR